VAIRLVVLLGAACSLLLAACTVAPSSPGGTPTGAEEGAPAPSFAFTTFDGQQIALADFAGRGVVLNFWASWCVPCREEMPYLDKVALASKDRGVAFMGLAMRDDEPSSRAFLDEVKVSYLTGADPDGDIARSYRVLGLPMTIFIRPDGTVARRWPGPISEAQLQEFVRDIS
jgi:peroxiredoxin